MQVPSLSQIPNTHRTKFSSSHNQILINNTEASDWTETFQRFVWFPRMVYVPYNDESLVWEVVGYGYVIMLLWEKRYIARYRFFTVHIYQCCRDVELGNRVVFLSVLYSHAISCYS